MKSLTLILGMLVVFSCKAQQVLPLNTFIDDIPANAHVKDLNNELNPYVGIYKANHQGKGITLYISKEENKLVKYIDQQFYRDALVIKFIIKNLAGVTLQDTKNNNLQTNLLYSTRIRSYDNAVILGYEGTNCGVGWGSIFLKKINATQISWLYKPNDLTILPG